MIKLLIFNACVGFHIHGLESMTVTQAFHIEKASVECKEQFNGCLKSVSFKRNDKNGYNAKYKCEVKNGN